MKREADVARIVDAALDMSDPERSAFVADACAGDAGLRAEVETLLAMRDAAGSFLDEPAIVTAARGEIRTSGILAPGHRIGAFRILTPIGAGGMGEVYKARDDALGRDVAIKVLPEIFTSDPARLARFEREARVVAGLNHPNIATLHAVEQVGGAPALVMELVEGQTLDRRLSGQGAWSRGALSVAEALNIARQIAEALEAAHERGIVHRDLKPANIAIRPDGVVKVLDFGLAVVLHHAAAGDAGPLPPADTVTGEGMLLGTAAYMSPEQARGHRVDKQTDVWAFGCVLYETLTGRPAFRGDTVSDTIAGILGAEPDWNALPQSLPSGIRRLLRRCLERDVNRRIHDMADARIFVEEAQRDLELPARAADDRPSRWRERAAWTTLGAALALGAAAAVWWTARPLAPEMRVEINTPPTTDATSLAISPDGRAIAFVATDNGTPRLWVQPVGSLERRVLAGTDFARFPFWSPDGRSIGFFAEAAIKRIDLETGAVRTVVARGVGGGHGAAWSPDDIILYAPSPGASLYRVSAEEGGQPEPVRLSHPAITGRRFAKFLPDGRRYLFYATGTEPGIYVDDLEGSGPRRIVQADAAVYSGSGHLLFVREGTLFAQPFDAADLELSGEPTALASGIVLAPLAGAAALSASVRGDIAYRTGPLGHQRQHVWFDRRGQRLRAIAGSESHAGIAPSLSHDGRWLALELRSVDSEGTMDLWMLNLEREEMSRFTFDPGFDMAAIWSPRDDSVVFQSNRAGPFALYLKRLTGAPNSEELLHRSKEVLVPFDWSADGRFLLYGEGIDDVWALPLDTRKPFPILNTAFRDSDAQFSRDGKWIAYRSNGEGGPDIYLMQFETPGRRWKVSRGGGVQPRWHPDNDELFYLARDNRLMSVPIRLDSARGEVEIGEPEALFPVLLSETLRGPTVRSYAVGPDGDHFLFDVPVEVTAPITLLIRGPR